MITKQEAANARVDWDTINRKTEIARTYMITVPGGGIIFKMYKPSQFLNGKVGNRYHKDGYWEKMIGRKDLSGKSHKEKSFRDICRERQMREMITEEQASYGYSYTSYRRGRVYGGY